MVSLTFSITLLSVLCAGLVSAAPTGTTAVESIGWPATARGVGDVARRSDDTNAQRLARGMPLKKPTVRNDLSRRYTAAPSQGVSTTRSETFYYQYCISSSPYYDNEYDVSASDAQAQVDACAEYSDEDNQGGFAIRPDGTCLTGIAGYANSEETCTSTDYAVYVISP